MYSQKITKSYSISAHSLDRLPLADFTEKLASIKSQFKASLAEERQKAEEEFLAKWNQSNESSFEGSLDEVVNLKVRSLGSYEPYKLAFETFSTRWNINANADWFFSQALAKFALLPLVRNSNGKISAKILYLEHISKDPVLMALWHIFKYPQRSVFLNKQWEPRVRDYSALVPLILSAFKKLSNIQYSEWDRSEIFGITEDNLTKAMLLDPLPDLSVAEVLELRHLALLVKSGPSLGSERNPVTTYSLYPAVGSPLHPLPNLARIMYCQTWCAHPNNRTKYMILNPGDWDNMPQPLVSGDIYLDSKLGATADLGAEMPWS